MTASQSALRKMGCVHGTPICPRTATSTTPRWSCAPVRADVGREHLPLREPSNRAYVREPPLPRFLDRAISRLPPVVTLQRRIDGLGHFQDGLLITQVNCE